MDEREKKIKVENQPRILCVDDEKNVLRALQRIFLDDDYEIITAPSGEEGLNVLKELDLSEDDQPVQVVISDYRMPGMSGVDFLKEVCTRWPATVRIVLSGYADTAAIVSAINEGQIYKFIPKPWNDDELRVTIAKAVELYLLRVQNSVLARELEQANQELRRLNADLQKKVKDSTGELVLRSGALIAAQNILDALPVAVLGLDPDGQIVQCNQKGMALFPGRVDLLGRDCDEVMTGELLSFIRKLPEIEEKSTELSLNSVPVLVRAKRFRGPGGQAGIVVVVG